MALFRQCSRSNEALNKNLDCVNIEVISQILSFRLPLRIFYHTIYCKYVNNLRKIDL